MNRYLVLLVFLLIGCTPCEPAPKISEKHPCIFPFLHANGSGTSFVLKVEDNTYLVTAQHVWDADPDRINADDTGFNDVYVRELKEADTWLEPSTLELPTEPRLSEAGYEDFPVTVIGFDAERVLRKSEGLVSGHFTCLTCVKPVDSVFTTAVVVPGMSGSPLLDKDGKVLGVLARIMYPKDAADKGQVRSAFVPVQRVLMRIRDERRRNQSIPVRSRRPNIRAQARELVAPTGCICESRLEAKRPRQSKTYSQADEERSYPPRRQSVQDYSQG